MTPQEQELIGQLFFRLKQTPVQQVDREAAELIHRQVAEQPDAAYKLVQTALIQDMALGQAQARIAELEKQVVDADAAQPASGGSFLPPQGPARQAGPWGRAEPAPAPAPYAGARQAGPETAAAPNAMGAGAMAGAGSGFLRTAAATAMGVIGGSMLFQGIQSMFGHGAGGLMAGQQVPPSLSETVVNNYYGDSASPSNDTGGTQVADNGDQSWDSSPGSSDVDIAAADDWGGDDSDLA